MIKGFVEFWDLGRSKAKGTFKIEADNEDAFNELMYLEFKKYLMSQDISFDEGKIFAGFHKVGDYRFVGIYDAH